MSSKISALPVCSHFDQTGDVLDCLSGAVNKQVHRDIFLTAQAGDSIFIACVGSQIRLNASGKIDSAFPAGQSCIFAQTGTLAQFGIGSSNDAFLISDNGQPVEMSMGTSGAVIRINSDGSIDIFPIAGQPARVGYVPAAPANWAGVAPSDLASAIDRIAAVVSASGAIPIP